MGRSIVYAVLVGVLGYALVVASALVVVIGIRLLTGYWASFTFFTLALVTLRLTEIHYVFLLAPPLVTFCAMVLLGRTWTNRRLAGGVSLSSYYVMSALTYLAVGGEEFALEVSLAWILWVFVLGLVSSVVADRILASG
jgi:hypothetical protein